MKTLLTKRSIPIALFLLIPACSEEPARLDMEKAILHIKDKTISVELARSPQEQERGLMFRKRLGENEGMIFMYDSPRMMNFWMKNTRIPLSVAFIDAHGRITQIDDMKPYDYITHHLSQFPSQYALEVNRGWFGRNGIKVGDTIEIPNPKSQIPK